MPTKAAPIEEALIHCMKCRRKRKSTVQYRVSPNNRGMLQGTCNKCGTKVSQITKVR